MPHSSSKSKTKQKVPPPPVALARDALPYTRVIPKSSSMIAVMQQMKGSDTPVQTNSETHELFDDLTRNEYDEDMIDNDPDIVLTSIPKSAVPWDSDSILHSLVDEKGELLYVDGRWRTFPGHSSTKKALTDWMEEVGSSVDRYLKLTFPDKTFTRSRHWTRMNDSKPVPDDSTDRQPDASQIGVDPSEIPKGKALPWCLQFVIAEHKSNKAARQDGIFQNADGARVMFKSQANRRHVIGFVLTDVFLSVLAFDRSGLVASDPFNIHDRASLFLHTLIGSLFADESEVGLDPTIILDGPNRSIEVDGEWYSIIDIIYLEGCLRGRGTVVYHVKKDGKEYIVKDSWVDTSRKDREAEVLEHLSGLKHIPKVVKEWAVKYKGEADTTAYFRKSEVAKGFKGEIREHRRLLLEPCGHHISDFRDLVELLTAIRDIADAIEGSLERDVVHRDVSLANCMLEEVGFDLRGLLIDFDNAMRLNRTSKAAIGGRTGTLPFMAIEILESNKAIVHNYYHDLESLLYVLIWICTVYNGPRGALRDESFNYRDSELCIWNGGMKHKDAPVAIIADSKRSIMTNAKKFEVRILNNFADYFEPIKGCVKELRSLLCTPLAKPAEEGELEDLEEVLRYPTGTLPLSVEILLKGLIPIERRPRKEIFEEFRSILDKTIDQLKPNRDPSKLSAITYRGPSNYDLNTSFYIAKPANIAALYRDIRVKKRKGPRKRPFITRGPLTRSSGSGSGRSSLRQSTSTSAQSSVPPSLSSGRSSKRAKISPSSEIHSDSSYDIVSSSPAASSFDLIDEEMPEDCVPK